MRPAFMEESMTRPPLLFSHSAVAHVCRKFWREDDGASLVEYVLLIALVAVVCVGAVTLLGSNTNAKLNSAANALK